MPLRLFAAPAGDLQPYQGVEVEVSTHVFGVSKGINQLTMRDGYPLDERTLGCRFNGTLGIPRTFLKSD
jgi:hypothetical protein